MYRLNLSFLFFCLSLIPLVLGAQNQPPSLQDKWQIKPIIGVQIWATHSHKGQYFDDSLGLYQALDPRYNVEIRRTRIGFTSHPLPQLQFKWVAAVDNVGRDVYSGVTGGSNNGAFPNLGLWDAFLQWQVLRERQLLFLTGGYLLPHLGRESYTSAFNVSSIEKSWSQNYIRRHLVGTGPGRTLGLNLGGQIGNKQKNINLSYNMGVFSPLKTGLVPNTSGRQAAALWVGHAIIHLGEPESQTYKRGHKLNYQGKRKGLSLGFGASHQGPTDLFALSQTLSLDFLANWGALNLDGDLTYLLRANEAGQRTRAEVLHLRASVNIPLSQQAGLLEPILLLTSFRGEMTDSQQKIAHTIGMLTGQDQLIDVGINWWLSPKLKLFFHYNLRSGDLGAAEAGSPINNYYFQAGAGAFQRPNWLGIGVQLQL